MDSLKRGRVLVTGLPDAGKTWMFDHVKDRVNGIDTDDTILKWGKDGGKLERGASAWWMLTHRPRWDHDQLRKLLKENDDFMVFGAPGRWQDVFRGFPKFDQIYYLYEDRKLMSERMKIERPNQFGTTAMQRAYAHVALVPLNIAAKIAARVSKKFTILDASLPTEELFSQILRD